MSTSRRYLVTLFEDEWEPQNVPPFFRYIVGQREAAPTTGRLHYQLYCELRSPQRLRAIKNYFGDAVHAEAAERSRQRCINYCTKEETRSDPPHAIEWPVGAGDGVALGGGQGRRSDLVRARDAARAGYQQGGARGAWEALYNDHFPAAAAYRRGFEGYLSHLAYRTRSGAPDVEVHDGPTGTGKTRQAFERFPAIFSLPPLSERAPVWFDGYLGQAQVLLDDFDGKSISLPYLLRILDRYPMQVPVKGGFVHWTPETIIITTNISVSHWYPEADIQHRRALERRITKYVGYYGEAPEEWPRERWVTP